jgi:RNA polymerase sigma-B factor
LIGAIERFDPRRGVRFVSLAFPAVQGAMLNHLRDQGSLVKASRILWGNAGLVKRSLDVLAVWLERQPTVTEVSDHCGLTHAAVGEALEFARTGSPRSLDESVGESGGEAAAALLDLLGHHDIGYDAAIDRITLEGALRSLPSREKTIISLKFYRGMTQREIAERIELSQMHVSRLERSALKKLKDTILGRDDKPTPQRSPM